MSDKVAIVLIVTLGHGIAMIARILAALVDVVARRLHAEDIASEGHTYAERGIDKYQDVVNEKIEELMKQ